MESFPPVILFFAVALVALLYSSVGHAGASGYIAVMTLAGFGAVVIKPTALVLNVLVACIGSIQFWRAGHFSWRLFWPFAALSVPAAFLGGYLRLPTAAFQLLVGGVLLFSAVRLFLRQGDPAAVNPPSIALAVGVGTVIGLLSGLTGTGGGIFLTPLMLLCQWARTKQAAAVSAVFILVNSLAGLFGHGMSGQGVPPIAWGLALAAVTGGMVGAHLGSRRLPVRAVSVLLAVVLVIAGMKLLFA